MPTTIKDAISKWEERTGEKAGEATRVDLYGQSPPVEKMDAALGILTNCERLGLSTNNIDKIAGLNALKKLKILSLGRNSIKSLTGLDNLGDTLEELWISYNQIDRLKGIQSLKKLRVLYMSHNLVRDMSEVIRVSECPKITELIMVGNPVYEKHSEIGDWTTVVSSKIKSLKKLDGIPIIRDDNDDDS